MNQANSTKLIPYGMTDFPAIIRNNYYYVDKTEYIRQIEQTARFFFFVRPRRFGKSLFLNMLECYYDCKTEKQFDELFGNLYVGKHPTPDRNKYLVLKMSFSSIVSDPEKMEASFNSNCDMIFTDFCLKYADLLPPDTLEMVQQKEVASEKLTAVCLSLRRQGLKMYLILDEYDNFANNVLVNYGNTRYRSLTHGDGFLRNFLKTVKDYTDRVVERMYITGVSPVTMDDLTSGFNIGTNYSLSPKFNEMIGFTEEEVRQMLTYYSTTSHFNHTVDELLDIMQPWYDNYCFAQGRYGETTMYNSNMVLYFIKNYLDNDGKAPQNMIESNIRVDYEKLRMLIRKDKEFAHDASIIQTLVSQGYITGDLKESFPAVNITTPDNFVSLLYYFGMLTISGTYEGKTKLTIPNQVVREQLYAYLLSTYDEADLNFSSYEKNELSSSLAYRGDWQTYFGYIADCLKRYASQRDKQKGEFFVHGFTLAMAAQNHFYRPISEQDTQAGYVDIFLCPLLEIYSDMKHSYIVELKYAKYKDSESRVEELRQEAITQANRYADTETVRNAIGTTMLHKIVVVYKGMDIPVCEEV